GLPSRVSPAPLSGRGSDGGLEVPRRHEGAGRQEPGAGDARARIIGARGSAETGLPGPLPPAPREAGTKSRARPLAQLRDPHSFSPWNAFGSIGISGSSAPDE